MFELATLVHDQSACELPGVGIKMETFLPAMWYAVRKGYVQPRHAHFVEHALRWGLNLGLHPDRLHGHRFFENYQSAHVHRVKVTAAVQERVESGQSLDLGEWTPAIRQAVREVFPAAYLFAMGAVGKVLEPNKIRPTDDHTRTGLNAATDMKGLSFPLDTVAAFARRFMFGHAAHVSDVSAAFPMLPLAPWLWPFFLCRAYPDGISEGTHLFVHINGDFGTRGMPGCFKIFMVDVVVKMAEAFGVISAPLEVYVDDLASMAATATQATREMRSFQEWATRVCGIIFKTIKDKLGSQLQLYLGFWWDSFTGTRTLEEQKLVAYMDMLTVFASRRTLSLLERQQVAGRMQRAVMTMPPGAGCLLSNLFGLMTGLSLQWHRRRTSRAERADYRFFHDILGLNLGSGYYRTDSFSDGPTVHTDASRQRDYAGGGWCSTDGWWDWWRYGSRAAKRPIDFLEGDTVVHCVERQAKRWRGKRIRFGIDNQAFQKSAEKGRSRADRLNLLLKRLFVLQIRYGCLLEFFWLPTEANYLADALSRENGVDKFLELVMVCSFLSASARVLRRMSGAGRVRRLDMTAPITCDDVRAMAARRRERVDLAVLSRRVPAAVRVQSAVRGWRVRRRRVRTRGLMGGALGDGRGALLRNVPFRRVCRGVDAPRVVRTGTILSETVDGQVDHYWVQFDDQPAMVKCELLPRLRMSWEDELPVQGRQALGQWATPFSPDTEDTYGEGLGICYRCLFPSNAVICPVCDRFGAGPGTASGRATRRAQGDGDSTCKKPRRVDDPEPAPMAVVAQPRTTGLLGGAKGDGRSALMEGMPVKLVTTIAPPRLFGDDDTDDEYDGGFWLIGRWKPKVSIGTILREGNRPNTYVIQFDSMEQGFPLTWELLPELRQEWDDPLPGPDRRVVGQWAVFFSPERDAGYGEGQGICHRCYFPSNADHCPVCERPGKSAEGAPSGAASKQCREEAPSQESDKRPRQQTARLPKEGGAAAKARRARIDGPSWRGMSLIVLATLAGVGAVGSKDVYSAQVASVQYPRALLYDGLPREMFNDLTDLMMDRLSESSLRTIDVAWRKWLPIAEKYAWDDVIYTDDNQRGGKLAAYVISLVRDKALTAESIASYVWGLRWKMKLFHQADPALGVMHWHDFMTGMRVIAHVPYEPRRAIPFRLLEAMVGRANTANFVDVQFVFFMLVLYFTFSRAECPCPQSFSGRSAWNPKKHWMVRDIVIRPVAGVFALCVRFKSVKQDGRIERPEARGDGSEHGAAKKGGADWAFVGDVPGSPLSVFLWYSRLMSFYQGPRPETDPFFVAKDRQRPYTYGAATTDLKRMLRKVSPEDTDFGLHGFRVRGYNDARFGASEELAVAQGGWRSSAHTRYARFPLGEVLRLSAAMVTAAGAVAPSSPPVVGNGGAAGPSPHVGSPEGWQSGEDDGDDEVEAQPRSEELPEPATIAERNAQRRLARRA